MNQIFRIKLHLQALISINFLEENYMKIKVNSEVQELDKDISIAELLILNKVDMPDMVSVQLNGEFLQRAEFQKTILKNNDEVDFLYFMGGGANRG